MKKFVLAVFIYLLFPSASFACWHCTEHFNAQAQDWCTNCEEANCGHETCVVKNEDDIDYCEMTGSRCFMLGYRRCPWEPVVQHERLRDTWKLAGVQVYHRAPSRRSSPRV